MRMSVVRAHVEEPVNGKLPEWLNGAASKAEGVIATPRRFESYIFRQIVFRRGSSVDRADGS